MASPAPVDVGDALDDLINQFSDPMSFFRELIQNALDAGSGEVEVEFEYEPSAKDPDTGAMTVHVVDFGEGMDREIIDNKLTRLFSSAKDGDMTKIGKFGIGFVSVFAIDPDAVCVDTARAGEAWRVLFDKSRSFKLFRLDQAMEGTSIRIIKSSTRAEYERFVTRAKQVIRYWCGHAKGEVRVEGELLSEPFGLEAEVLVRYEDEFSHIYIGHTRGARTLHGFFNGGLTLVQADQHHGTAIEELIGLSFKVSSRYLEHTLTRDDVIKDGHFGKVVKRLQELARGQLRERVFEEIETIVRAGYPEPGSVELERLQVLYGAALWHLRDGGGVSRALSKRGCVRAPSGRVWTWGELAKAGSKGLYFSSAATPLSARAEQEGRAVVLTFAELREPGSAPSEDADSSPSSHTSLINGPIAALVASLILVCGLNADKDERPEWLGQAFFIPLEPDRGEQRKWASLASMSERLLADSGHRCAGVKFGHFEASGSLLGGRPAITQRSYGEATARADAGELGTGLFSRRRVLVIDADHPSVRVLLGLAVREPELAAYQLVKLFLLLGGAIEAKLDSELAATAMGYRELRCPKPLS